MRRVTGGLLAAVVLSLIGMLTVGHENDFGFACFLVFCAAVLGLAATAVLALRRRGARDA